MQPDEPFVDKAVTSHQRDLEGNLRSSPSEPFSDFRRLCLLQIARARPFEPFKQEHTWFGINSFD